VHILLTLKDYGGALLLLQRKLKRAPLKAFFPLKLKLRKEHTRLQCLGTRRYDVNHVLEMSSRLHYQPYSGHLVVQTLCHAARHPGTSGV